MSIEAMKLWLEALEKAEHGVRMLEAFGARMCLSNADMLMDKDSVFVPAIASLRQAIAEAEKQQYNPTSDHRLMLAEKQEPVAWRFTGIAGFKKYITDTQYQSFHQDAKKWYEPYRCVNCTNPQPKVEQEPKREPLTDEQILEVARDHYSPNQRPEISFARAIEAAHGIKGEA